jgi:hypothetical protein
LRRRRSWKALIFEEAYGIVVRTGARVKKTFLVKLITVKDPS